MSPEELEGQLARLLSELDGHLNPLVSLRKSLGRHSRPGGLAGRRSLEEAARLLEGAALPGPIADAAARLAADLVASLDERARTIRGEFLERFLALFVERGVTPRLLAEAGPEYRVSPFTVTIDFSAESAQLLFARLPFGKPLALDATRVVDAWRSGKEALESRALDPDRFSGALVSAYRALLARRGRSPGDRVELSEVYPEVAFALQPQKLLDEADRRHFVSYGRVEFVRDLLRLRKERGLKVGEHRVDLGVAVAGAATQRRRAFWLEDESGTGMFYSSFRLVPQATLEG
ncbi:MAG: hypothetical protein HY815_29115 [Candidatus Riflebacteria bacterium]|nr:hypothetical protein [Candidatus Riflebacteria bacterium]